jgi:hypothetical protein
MNGQYYIDVSSVAINCEEDIESYDNEYFSITKGVLMNRSDYFDMLEVLLSHEKDLDDSEKEELKKIKDGLDKKVDKITKLQREKINVVWKRLGFDDLGVKNLWSSGKVPMGKPMEFPYNLPRPLKPPGRK